jgi:hypothetical protein
MTNAVSNFKASYGTESRELGGECLAASSEAIAMQSRSSAPTPPTLLEHQVDGTSPDALQREPPPVRSPGQGSAVNGSHGDLASRTAEDASRHRASIVTETEEVKAARIIQKHYRRHAARHKEEETRQLKM